MTRGARTWSGATCLLAMLMPLCGMLASGAQSSSDGLVPPIRIDAVIGDSRWIPIPNLRASDIELVEDGIPRRIESAELRTVPRRTSADTSPIESLADEERAAREPGARVFIFVLDEFHVSPGQSAERAQTWMADFVDAKIYDRDLALVVRPLDPVRTVRLTRDHALLHGVIAGFTGRKGEYEPRTPLEEQSTGRDPATIAAARRRIVVDQLNDIALRLGTLKADRPIVVFVSEGFPAGEHVLEPFLRASSARHFAVYTINPARPEDDVAGPAERGSARTLRQRLAAQGGGLAVEADGIIAGFARVAHDSESYWALTYQPHAADGGFHTIEVRAGGSDTKVRTRSGYWATPATETSPSTAARQAEMTPRRPLRRNELVEPWVGVAPAAGGAARMTITWEPKETRGRVPEVLAVKARTLDGRALFDGSIHRVGALSGSGSDCARFSVPTGRVELDMTVLDAAGTVIETEARDVDVPNLTSPWKAGPILLAAEIVRVRTSRELEAAKAVPDAPPAALRTFARQDSLLIRVPAHDASGTAVTVTARLLNQTGAPIRTLEAIDLASRPGVTQFLLPLHFLAPGPYQVELTGTNKNGVVTARSAFRTGG
jgi:VWFA-related protein